MKCFYCQGQLQRGFTAFQAARKGYHLTLDRAPAWVCTQCGEAMFDENQSAALQEMLKSLDQKTEDLVVAK
jgi:YgiT-type zinc finger domain-containing protein